MSGVVRVHPRQACRRAPRRLRGWSFFTRLLGKAEEQGHCAAPAPLQTAAIQFLLDHPFGVTPKPYAGGLPASFPSYCTVR